MTPAPAEATVRDVLAGAIATLAAAGVPEPRADAEVLLARALEIDRAGLVVRAREPLDPAVRDRFAAALGRRASREPLAYVLGEWEFWSLPLAVDRRVLIPRPETELVVETALRLAPEARCVLDVGTGSGAIAIAFARERPAAAVVAVDRDAGALAVAAVNRERHAPGVALVRADLCSAFRPATFDLVVANPPYCATGTVVQAEVRDFEPETALYAGADGLDVLRALLAEAARVLVPRGWLVTELGAGQAAALRAAAAGSAWDGVDVARDLAGIERVMALRRAGW